MREPNIGKKTGKEYESKAANGERAVKDAGPRRTQCVDSVDYESAIVVNRFETKYNGATTEEEGAKNDDPPLRFILILSHDFVHL
jgi:hypothetical protein